MSIRLLIDKPTIGLRHLCENCQKSHRMAGPGYERYRCDVLGPITQMVTECDMHRAPEYSDQALYGQWKQQAFHVQRVNGETEILSPEEMAAWDYWTDHNTEPFDLKAFREKEKQRGKAAAI